MFKRAFFSSAFKVSSGLRGVAAAGAVVALSDKEFKKKPSWFKDSVNQLTPHLVLTSKYQVIESASALDQAYDVLRRVEDCNNPEVSWRLGRILVEKSNLVNQRDHHMRHDLLHGAMEYFHKALANEPASGMAGAHKWYAVCLQKLKVIDKKNKHLANADAEITHHLKRAVELEPNDCIAWHFLGVHLYTIKNYKEAIDAFKKSEELKPLFSASNAFYLGKAYLDSGNKDEAIKWLKTSLPMKNRNEGDARAKAVAREILLKQLKQTPESIDTGEDF